jgi:hypothetical protein
LCHGILSSHLVIRPAACCRRPQFKEGARRMRNKQYSQLEDISVNIIHSPNYKYYKRCDELRGGNLAQRSCWFSSSNAILRHLLGAGVSVCGPPQSEDSLAAPAQGAFGFSSTSPYCSMLIEIGKKAKIMDSVIIVSSPVQDDP